MSTAIYGIVAGVCSLITFAVYLAFFIVTFTVVRTRRPDAWFPICAGAFTLMMDYAGRWIISTIMPMAMSRAGAGLDGYYVYQSLINVMGTGLAVIAWALIIVGVARIASPPREFSLNRPPGG